MTKQKKSLRYEDLSLPNYVNTRRVFANLDVSDLVKAAVLAPLNILLVGDTGTGKTQLASDIYHYYFKGNKKDWGQGVFIRANPEIDIYNEVFSELNVHEARRELTDNIEALIYNVDELNRAPPVAQNQFFCLGDGKFDFKGRAISLGRDNYHIAIATANLGNGEFQGTFETDKALYNRLHVAFDFDYPGFMPTIEDENELDQKEADPNVKESKPRDISQKIIKASRKIGDMSSQPSLEERAVTNYIRFGLRNCHEVEGKRKGKSWPFYCQECEQNNNGEALCSLIRTPTRRTLNAMTRYANALAYLSKLKDPDIETDPVEYTFKAFELTGAYQHLLNPYSLNQKYKGENPVFMQKVVNRLKEDFDKNKEFMMASLEEAQKGKRVLRFFIDGGELGNYEDLKEKLQEANDPIEPYTDSGPVGLSWMEEIIDYEINKAKARKTAKTTKTKNK